MFKNLKIGIKLALSFAAVLALLLVISVAGALRLAELNHGTDDITNNL